MLSNNGVPGQVCIQIRARSLREIPLTTTTLSKSGHEEALVDADMGIAILPASAVKHSVARVVACEIVGQMPMSEIAIAVSKRARAAVVGNFRSFALKFR